MIAVVFDLELVKRFRKGQPSEIVEIGACKVDLTEREIVDELQVYTLPRSGHISKSTRRFIKMTEEDVKKAIPFSHGIELLTNWIGDNYYLCSWGKDDKFHLMDQCIRNKLELDWLKNYNDIQPQIGKVLDPEHPGQLGLKNALQLAGLEPIGKAHRGIDDTINTARLLLTQLEHVSLQENEISSQEIKRHKYKAKQRRFLHKKHKNNEKVKSNSNHSQ